MGGNLDLGPAIGEIEIGQYHGQTLPVRYDLRSWTWPRCEGSSPGGLIFDRCVGRIEFELLAQ
jgi:hypothetical protein